ncbi:SGNH/GDSL hydrolase family protein [Xanthomonas sp. NCPPB 2632]|uniref:SGNH/GDSL hydrolase family protein n=1 Tax=Xanthomonas sp. NCPPB 2632 TaxID=3240912 RepID=UPI003518D63A
MTCTTRWRLAALAIAAIAAGTVPAQQHENVFDRPTQAKLRCWYKTYADPSDLRTSWVEADDFTLTGHWRTVNNVYLGSMFFTLQEPEDIHEACRTTLTKRRAAPVVQASAASTDIGQNHEIWYDGDIASRRGMPVERIVAFGDSLSDTGNVYGESRQTFPIHTSWFLGRFSNGPVWTEYLARRTGLPLNTWATGGAQTNNAYLIINGLKAQVDSFLRYRKKNRNTYDVSRTLFTVWIGANDFVTAARKPAEVLADLKYALDALVDDGARKIVVLGQPDLSQVPTFRVIPGTGEGGRSDGEAVHASVREFNRAIPGMIHDMSLRTGAQFVFVDAEAKLRELMADPGRFGMTGTDTACLDLRSQGSGVYAVPQGVRRDCDPHTHVFWDMMHPTTRTHELISRWVLDEMPYGWGLR